MSIGVYKITNIITGKFYIGSSKNIEARLKGHFKDLETNTHGNKHLQNSYNKYGKEVFITEILEITTLENLRSKEDYYIKQTKCYDRNIGYNIAKGAVGSGSDYFTEETLQKLRQPKSEEMKKKLRETFKRNGHSKGEKNPNYGKHWSEKWKIEQSKRLKNNPKLAKAKRFTGKHHTDNSKVKTSLSLQNTRCLNTLHTPKNLFEISNWTFSTNHKNLRNIESSNIIIKKLFKFFEQCDILNKHGAYIVPFNDNDNTNSYIVDEPTFLRMKELLDRYGDEDEI